MTKPMIATRRSTSDQSFEETYQEVYSHGLESIYALESVDLKTLRPLAHSKGKLSLPPPIQKNPHLQLSFDFDQVEQFPAIFLPSEVNLRKALNLPNDRIILFWKVLHDHYIDPWVRGRLGIVYKDEIIERLEMISSQQDLVPILLNRIQNQTSPKGDPFSHLLYTVEPELYVASPKILDDFQRVVKTAETYFYRGETRYELESLVSWIEREHGRVWRGFREGFVRKVLEFSARFIMTKTLQLQVIVHCR